MSLRVLAVGAGASLQDGGRPGYRRFGVPIAGAFDRESLALGNALVGNHPAAAALELTVMGVKLQAGGRHLISIVGAELDATLNGSPAETGAAITMESSDVLALGPMRGGARGYVCVAGGFKGEQVLGSVSGLVVEKGDVLEAQPCEPQDGSARLAGPPESLHRQIIRIVPGPQRDAFAESDLEHYSYEVSSHSNRAGIRFLGPALKAPSEAPSEPMCVGAMQIAGDGRPIVIGPDGPTIGGYPKIACVVQADHSRLGQLLPGDAVQFRWVSLEAARTLSETEAGRIAARCATLGRSHPPTRGLHRFP